MNRDEQRQFDEWVQHHRETTVAMMADSAYVVSIVPRGETDVKFALELGLSIMLDKPILAIVAPGTSVPPKLLLVADEVFEGDIDVEADRERLAAVIKDMLGPAEASSAGGES